MRDLTVLFFAFIGYVAVSRHLISWSAGTPLTWNNYKGVQPKNDSNFAAGTTTTITYKYDIEKQEIVIVSTFNEDSSWVRSDQRNGKVLKHEQGHFNITEIYSRLFRKEISGKKFNIKNIDFKVLEIYNTTYTLFYKEENLYDEQTHHGSDTVQQSKWDTDISNRLNGLSSFADTVVRFRFVGTMYK